MFRMVLVAVLLGGAVALADEKKSDEKQADEKKDKANKAKVALPADLNEILTLTEQGAGQGEAARAERRSHPLQGGEGVFRADGQKGQDGTRPGRQAPRRPGRSRRLRLPLRRGEPRRATGKKDDPAPTPAELHKNWMDSPGHRKNILQPKAIEVGLGKAQRQEGGLLLHPAVRRAGQVRRRGDANMDTEGTLLAALHADPTDHACWLALADWLEEDGQPRRAELLRLRLLLQHAAAPSGTDAEKRLRQLLDEGTKPVAPVLDTTRPACSLALIPAGTFRMGSPPGEPGRHRDEDPCHHVELTRPFYLGVCPVTQGQYQHVMGHNPSHFRTGGDGRRACAALDTRDFPVERVSWDDAVALLRRGCRSCRRSEAAAATYRLPTRGGVGVRLPRPAPRPPFHFGDSLGVGPGELRRQPTRRRRRRGGRTCADLRGRVVPAQRLRAVRHARQRLGVVLRLVRPGLLRRQPAEPTRRGRRRTRGGRCVAAAGFSGAPLPQRLPLPLRGGRATARSGCAAVAQRLIDRSLPGGGRGSRRASRAARREPRPPSPRNAVSLPQRHPDETPPRRPAPSP